MTDPIDDFVAVAVAGVESDTPNVTAYFDLTNSPGGGVPPALSVAKSAFSEAREALGATRRREVRALEAEWDGLEAALNDAVAQGALGLAYIGDGKGEMGAELTTQVPFRNDLHVGPTPWMFELERYRYLYAPEVTIALTNIHSVDAYRIEFGGVAERLEETTDQRALSKRSGRTRVEGHAGPGRAAGGHAKNKVEQTVEAHRDMFGKDAAAKLEELAGGSGILVVAGVDEARSQLLGHLPDRLREVAIQLSAALTGTEERQIVAMAAGAAAQSQAQAANSLFERVTGGAVGDLAARGRTSVSRALDQGQLAELLIHDDVVSHWGTADDARRRDGLGDDPFYEGLLRSAADTSAVIRFASDPRLLADHEGVAGLLRW